VANTEYLFVNVADASEFQVPLIRKIVTLDVPMSSGGVHKTLFVVSLRQRSSNELKFTQGYQCHLDRPFRR